MVTITLDDRDRAVLERLAEGDAGVETLAEGADCDPEYLRDRLPDLADNGLVERVADGYALTENGVRAMVGTPAGLLDDRIDTPEDVERAIEDLDLRADREDALRNAVSFLHYWGTATAGEIVDGVYSEDPAGFESRAEWWTAFVRDRLAALPLVDPADDLGRPWRYEEVATVDEVTDDGRLVPGGDSLAQSSVKYAIERSDLDDEERAAVRAAVDALVFEGEVDAEGLAESVYPDFDAGYDSAAAWWTDCVRDALIALPGVERADGDPDVLRYGEG